MISIHVGNRDVELSNLEVIRVVARFAGFEEVDVEPSGAAPNHYNVTARRQNGTSLTVSGTLDTCREKFVARTLT